MTTILRTSPEGAPDSSVGALVVSTPDGIALVDPYRGLKRLLPKLKKPSWVRLMGKRKDDRRKAVVQKPAPVSHEQAAYRERKRAARKPKGRSKIARALAGEFTRVTRAA